MVTVFLEPPSEQSPEGHRPAPAGEYHGLLESRETGALWYQPINQRRLPAFLTRAGTVARWALYPEDDATKLRAVMPIEQH